MPSVWVCCLWAGAETPRRRQKCKHMAKKQHLLPESMSSPLNNITLIHTIFSVVLNAKMPMPMWTKIQNLGHSVAGRIHE